MNDLYNKNKCDIINLILKIKPKSKKGRLWSASKNRLINYYLKIKK